MYHSKTINIVGDIVSRYDKEEGKSIESFIDKSRIYREIFSYKFPAEGLRGMNLNFEKVVEICSLLAEIAQLQSAILESAILSPSACNIKALLFLSAFICFSIASRLSAGGVISLISTLSILQPH